MVSEVDRLGERFETDRGLGQPGYRRGSRHGARRQDELVIGKFVLLAALAPKTDRPVLAIVMSSGANEESSPPQGSAEGHHHVSWLERPAGGLGQKRGVRHRVVPADEGGLNRPFRQSLQLVGGGEPSEPASDDQDVGPLPRALVAHRQASSPVQ